MPHANVIGLVESSYALESSERSWLGAIARSARDAFRDNFGAYALTYDASDIHDCKFEAIVLTGIEEPRLQRILRHDMAQAYRRAPAFVDAVFRKTPFGPSALLPLSGELAATRAELMRLSGGDILGLNGVNVDGRGLHVGVLVPEAVARRRKPDVLARLSSHLAAAFRLRAKLNRADPTSHAEAILDARGRVAHATGTAKLREARETLATAAASIDRLRGAIGKRDPERALERWRALVDARWSLVDHFERDGKRYVVAHRNDPAVAPFALLSRRERQVVAMASLGHANKMIGYELGISASTVSVLLGRASRKLGVRSRAALVAAYHARRQ